MCYPQLALPSLLLMQFSNISLIFVPFFEEQLASKCPLSVREGHNLQLCCVRVGRNRLLCSNYNVKK